MYRYIRSFLFLLNPELAHHISMKGLKLACFFGLIRGKNISSKPIMIMGLKFPNRIGLAAGLDKNAEYITSLSKLGFGFIEVGTVTPRSQPGNSRPRSFRLIKEEGIINRFGFNNVGIDKFIENIKKANFKGVLGINIGKNFDTPIDKAVDDYLICFRKAYRYAGYIAINISSPNTKNLRHLQNDKYLEILLKALNNEQKILHKKFKKLVPFVVKVSPDNSSKQLNSIAKLLLKYKVNGVIATNTTIDRKGILNSKYSMEEGGLSGAPLNKKSTNVIKHLNKCLEGKIPIIGVGGIITADDGIEKIKNGASLIQIYSGLIFRGHELVNELRNAIR
ncbi:MAG: quinone-dependent dihydroorotate dehydrogenase [Nitrosomonadales bacterium]|jgi:dihydroorotate dehydrogenase|nr:quinone-dependent dihydroorotate dehydrogenase [Nitrosomonadales bacterium]